MPTSYRDFSIEVKLIGLTMGHLLLVQFALPCSLWRTKCKYISGAGTLKDYSSDEFMS